MGVVPSFDELEERQLCLGVRAEGVAVDEFAFEGRKEALAHCIVEAIADRTHRRADAGLLEASSERDGRVRGALV